MNIKPKELVKDYMLVVLEGGEKCIVLNNKIVTLTNGIVMSDLERYDENLLHINRENYNIVELYKVNTFTHFTLLKLNIGHYQEGREDSGVELIWTRKESEKQVTFQEAITSNSLIKVVVPDELNNKYRKYNGFISICILNSYWNNKYFTVGEMLDMLSKYDDTEKMNVLINECNWYVQTN